MSNRNNRSVDRILFEACEPRRMLSGDGSGVLTGAGLLIVTGTRHEDVIEVTVNAGDPTKLD